MRFVHTITPQWKKVYPPEAGWMRMDAVLTSANPLSEEDVRKIAGMGSDRTEVAEARQSGKKLSIIFKSRSSEDAAAAVPAAAD